MVHVNFPSEQDREELGEFRELAISAGANPVATITGARVKPDPKYFVGSGKAEEVRDCVLREEAEVALFNHALSPSQERNLEKLLNCRVLDRTGLILDIFAQRARSFEGKLQVELAQLKHLATRLIRGWTHLERQKGGIGLRGPGETQLETDRRLIGSRIKQLNKRLDQVARQRGARRRARHKAAMPTVSLVGYTNVGKSTLFNRLTAADVYAANQLFATLDPTLRKVILPTGDTVIAADTVGFIRHLPHDLIAAFHSTLEETREANLLLHVIDASDPNRDEHIAEVQAVLSEIGADEVPQLQVYNKIDLIADAEPRIDLDESGKPRRIWLSANTGAGIELLLQVLTQLQGKGSPTAEDNQVQRAVLLIPTSEGKLRAQLYERRVVITEKISASGDWCLEVELPVMEINQLVAGEQCQLVQDENSDCSGFARAS